MVTCAWVLLSSTRFLHDCITVIALSNKAIGAGSAELTDFLFGIKRFHYHFNRQVTGAGSDELFSSLGSNCPALKSLLASYSQKGKTHKIQAKVKRNMCLFVHCPNHLGLHAKLGLNLPNSKSPFFDLAFWALQFFSWDVIRDQLCAQMSSWLNHP